MVLIKKSESRDLLSADSPIPWWVRSVVVVGSLLMAAGALIALIHPALLVSPGAEISGAVRVYAGYLFSRNLAVAIMLLLAMGVGCRMSLNILLILAGLIQFLDAGVDCTEGRWPIAIGVTVLGTLFLRASARISGAPFWRAEAWK
jgi:hypothetical protein